jgi:hypothetical protein
MSAEHRFALRRVLEELQLIPNGVSAAL